MIGPGGYTTLATGLIMLGVGGWLLQMGRRQPAILAFASYLLVTGANASVSPFAYASDLAPETRLLLSRLNMVLYFSRPFVLVLFLLAYPRPREFFGSTKLMPIVVISLLFLVESLYVLAPSLHRMEYFDESGRMVLSHYGPLTFLGAFLKIIIAAAALLFLRESASGTRRRSALLLVSLAFSIRATTEVFGFATRFLLSPQALIGDGWWITGQLTGLCAAFFLFPALVQVARRAAVLSDSAARRAHAHYLLTVAAVAVVAVMQNVVAPQEHGTRVNPVQRFIDGGIGLIFVGLVTYALVRHRFLGIDVKIKWTLKQSTVAAIFIGLFFIVSESAAAFFSDRVGTYMGIVAAGALVFAIAPLQHFAQRVADRAMPGVKAVGEMSEDERARIYIEQVHAAWADGTLSADERNLLERLRQQLSLSREEAHRLEHEASSGSARAAGTGGVRT